MLALWRPPSPRAQGRPPLVPLSALRSGLLLSSPLFADVLVTTLASAPEEVSQIGECLTLMSWP